jgi:hypothetical protein
MSEKSERKKLRSKDVTTARFGAFGPRALELARASTCRLFGFETVDGWAGIDQPYDIAALTAHLIK